MEIIKLDLQSLLWLFLPFILVLALAVISRIFWVKRASKSELGHYSLRQTLLSGAEANFFVHLKQVLGDEYEIFPKIRLADVFFTKNGQGYYSALNKITAKHIDFLLCDPKTFSPTLAIELDDKSHQRENRRVRDQFVDHLFSSQELPLIRIKVSRNYNVEVTRQVILESLKS